MVVRKSKFDGKYSIFKVKLRRFISRNFSSTVSAVYSFKFNLINFNKTPPVIIISFGKVGSSSVYNTLKKTIPYPVFHVHQISKEGITNSYIEHLNSDRKSIPLHLIISKILRKKLNKYNGPIYLITIVREPISRTISAFFQNTEFLKTV